MKRLLLMSGAIVAFSIAGATGALATEVWSGLDYYFEKPNWADWTLPENQDRITDNVWITRQDWEGLFNIAVEDYYNFDTSPADTEWAFSGLNGNMTWDPGEGAAQYESLVFDYWVWALEWYPAYNFMDTPGVVHLISEDIYIDLLCEFWMIGDDGGGGGFSYYRGIPEPATLSLLVLGGLLAARRRR